MYDDFYFEPETTTTAGTALGVYMYIMLIALYFYGAYMMYRIAQKTGHSDIAWWAYIPILNTILLVQMAEKPIWWLALLLVPFVNVVAFFILWMETARNAGSSRFWGFLVLVPGIHLLALLMIAFAQRPYVYPDETPMVPPSHPKTPQQVG